MVKHVVLDNVTHKDLKIITRRGAEFGDEIAYTSLMPQEFRRSASCFPVVFRKSSTTGKFESLALLGLDPQENLLLQGEKWLADYIPLSIRRAPFMIGYGRVANTDETQPIVHLDIDHPRVSFTEGEPVFTESGGHSPYLKHVNGILAELVRGVAEMEQLVEALSSFDLLEPFTFRASSDGGGSVEVKGFYTISEERLNALGSAELSSLHRYGYLELIYMVVASMANLGRLVKLKTGSNSISNEV